MKRSAIIIFHAGYWAAYLAIWAIVGAAISQTKSIDFEGPKYYMSLVFGVAIVPAIYTFYTFYFLLFPRYLQQRKITETIVSSTFVALSSFLFTVLTLGLLLDMELSCYAESNYVGVLIVFFIALINGIVAFVIKGFITWYLEIKIKEELKEKNHAMEMALVKSQLDPHFLFNTLNNIDILIIKDPQEASAYLNKLSDIMRFMLFETKSEEIPLERELEYIQKFIELQKIRTANDEYVNYKVSGSPKNKKIAPMVFIPFIENAFKHSNNKKLKDAINIEFEINDHQVSMHCINKMDPTRHTKIESNGLGNELIFKRLSLVYPNRHSLKVEHDEQSYSINLNIDYGSL